MMTVVFFWKNNGRFHFSINFAKVSSQYPSYKNYVNQALGFGKEAFPLVGEWQGRQDQSEEEEEEEGKTLIHHLKQERG
jgi:hypothetical protein